MAPHHGQLVSCADPSFFHVAPLDETGSKLALLTEPFGGEWHHGLEFFDQAIVNLGQFPKHSDYSRSGVGQVRTAAKR
jgi:hypothetical protein